MFNFRLRILVLFRQRYFRKVVNLAKKRPVNLVHIQTLMQSKCKNEPSSVFSHFAKIYALLSSGRGNNLNCNNLIVAITREFGKTDIVTAIQFAERFPPRIDDQRFDKTIAEYYLKNNRPVLALNHISRVSESRASKILLKRIQQSLESDNLEMNDTLSFVKHAKEVTLTGKGYSLYLPLDHIHRTNSDDLMKLSGALRTPPEAPVNCALISISFYDERGKEQELSSDSMLKQSSLVGPYQYINPEEDGTFSMVFMPPKEFHYALITLRSWKNTSGVKLGPILEITSSIEHNKINSLLEGFEKVCRLHSQPMVFVYGSYHPDPSISIDRPSRLISNFISQKVPTINGYFRKNRKPIPENDGLSLHINLPLDFVNSSLANLSSRNYAGLKKILYISEPSPTLIRKIHKFNSNNWVIVCDLHSWQLNEESEFSQGQLHLLSNSNVILTKNNLQRRIISNIDVNEANIITSKEGRMESIKKKKRSSRDSNLFGILLRPDDEIDFKSIAKLAENQSEKRFDILGSSWPMDIEKPQNVKTWTVRDAHWTIERMLSWNLAIDLPLTLNKGPPLGITELRQKKVPCIIPATELNSKTMPYLIRYNNFPQIETAIEEALIMERTYVPENDLESWPTVAQDILTELSIIEPSTKQESYFDYLPLAELISLAEQKPPKMGEIKSRVQQAFSSQGLSIYRDLIWALDYLCSNQNLPQHISNNLLIASIRGLGAVDPYTALQLAENFEFKDKRYARTMITLYNRTEQYEKSMNLLKKLKNDSWKAKMSTTLQRKLASGIPSKQRTGFFNILPQKRISSTKRAVNVACILDKFTFESLSPELNLKSIPKENWKEFLLDGDFDFLLAESIWKGHDEEWIWAMTSPDSPNGLRLKELLDFCTEIGLKKVFWNKEDPVNYDKFIGTASRFDLIFTSDNRSIPQYMEDCKHKEIYAMPFACQPIIHNPVRNKLPRHNVCFAGSWYIREHGDRKRQTKLLIDASRNYDLHVYDRFYGTNDQNRFPSTYTKFVRGSMPYEECCMAYRAYKIFLNVNSVMNSDTMFSRRVFEILASSTHVLSTPSEGMEKMLPYGITVVDSLKEADNALTKLIDDDEYRNRSAHLGYRHVMNNHTYTHRVSHILEKLGMDNSIPSENPKVSLITCTNRPDMISNVLQNFTQQTWENKESIIVIDCSQEEYLEIQELVKPIKNVVLYKVVEGLSLGHCFNKGMELSSGDYIGKFDDDDLYGTHYLSDQLLAFNYTNADIVGKLCTFMYHEKSGSTYQRFPDHRHKYGDLILGPTFLFKKKVAEKVKMRDLSKSEDTNFLRDAIKSGFKIYATDPYNFVYMRKKVEGFHTWDATDEELLKKAIPMGSDDPEKYAFL